MISLKSQRQSSKKSKLLRNLPFLSSLAQQLSWMLGLRRTKNYSLMKLPILFSSPTWPAWRDKTIGTKKQELKELSPSAIIAPQSPSSFTLEICRKQWRNSRKACLTWILFRSVTTPKVLKASWRRISLMLFDYILFNYYANQFRNFSFDRIQFLEISSDIIIFLHFSLARKVFNFLNLSRSIYFNMQS